MHSGCLSTRRGGPWPLPAPLGSASATTEPSSLDSFLILSFSYFFASVPCARLSWPSRQLLSAAHFNLPYRIVSCTLPSIRGRHAVICVTIRPQDCVTIPSLEQCATDVSRCFTENLNPTKTEAVILGKAGG